MSATSVEAGPNVDNTSISPKPLNFANTLCPRVLSTYVPHAHSIDNHSLLTTWLDQRLRPHATAQHNVSPTRSLAIEAESRSPNRTTVTPKRLPLVEPINRRRAEELAAEILGGAEKLEAKREDEKTRSKLAKERKQGEQKRCWDWIFHDGDVHCARNSSSFSNYTRLNAANCQHLGLGKHAAIGIGWNSDTHSSASFRRTG